MIRKKLRGLIPAGAVSGVLAVSFLAAPGVLLGIGTGYNYGGPNCSAANISASPGDPQVAGASVTLTATASSCTNPEFQFYVQAPGAGWVAQGGFLIWPANTFVWNTSGLKDGTYGIGVWARHSGATSSTFEAWATATYRVFNNCMAAHITASPDSPKPTGTVVTFTATATGCASPVFKFWVSHNGPWKPHTATFGTANTWVADTTGSPAGAYRVGVWIKQTGSTVATYQSYAWITYWLT